jgi:hypothetical protein
MNRLARFAEDLSCILGTKKTNEERPMADDQSMWPIEQK